ERLPVKLDRYVEVAGDVEREEAAVVEQLGPTPRVVADPRQLARGLSRPLVAAGRVVELERGDLGQQVARIGGEAVEGGRLGDVDRRDEGVTGRLAVMTQPLGAALGDQGLGDRRREADRARLPDGTEARLRGPRVVAEELADAGVGE